MQATSGPLAFPEISHPAPDSQDLTPYCVIRIAWSRSAFVICDHTICAFCFSALFSGSCRSASAKYRYAVGRSFDRQCPVA